MAIIVALGANLGDRMAALQTARRHLTPILADINAAPVYETAPCYVTDQPKFLNTVLRGTTVLTPLALLRALQDIESAMGRTAGRRYGPREIDLDIIYYNDIIMSEPGLAIPHPLRRERRFVLQPLADIAPELVDPETRQTISVLLAQLPPDPTMTRHAADW